MSAPARDTPSTKPLIDKLGVKSEHRVCVIAIDDDAFLRAATTRAACVTRGRPKRGDDLVFLGITRHADLDRLAALERTIARNGAVWAVWPKGNRELNEDHVRAAAIRAGLVDVKVVAFSATHSALKLVIPLARR